MFKAVVNFNAFSSQKYFVWLSFLCYVFVWLRLVIA